MAKNEPIALDEQWFTNERKPFDFSIVDDDGAVVDITGWTIWWGLWAGTSLLLEKTASVTDGPAGECRVLIESADTVDIVGYPTVLHYHELWRTDTEGLLSYGDAYLQQARRGD